MNKKKIELEQIILVMMFGIIFLANNLSPLCIDDFGYAFSRATDERITNFIELISSVNAFSANGRYIACFLIQLFLIFPKVLFNIVNSIIFIFQLVLLRRLCCTDARKNWKILIGIIGLIWCFVPAFGEDYLWLCAAISYSWGATLSLLYTCYFSRYLHNNIEEYSIIRQIAICIIGFLLGAYAETTAILAVVVPAVYCFAVRIIYTRKIKLWLILSEISACSGLLFLVTRPAERIKIMEPSFSKYLTRLHVLVIKYIEAFWILLLFFFIFLLFVLIKMKCSDKKYLIQKYIDSAIYLLISLGINSAMIFASSYPSRVMLLTGLFLFLSILSFVYEAKDIVQYDLFFWRIWAIATGVVMMGTMFYGMYDICNYGNKISIMYANIKEQADLGNVKIVVSECPEYDSKYINYNEYAYFNTDPENYVNKYFMRYMKYDGTIQVEDKSIKD